MIDDDELKQARETYFNEMQELLQEIEDNLLEFQERDESDSVNSLFRAFHTIKGTSEMFGFGDISHFAHSLENLLDLVRKGEDHITPEMIPWLLKSGDHIARLLAGNDTPESIANSEKAIFDNLFHKNGVVPKPAPGNPSDSTGPGDLNPSEPGLQRYTISLQLKPDVFRHGLDPYPFLRYLQKLGTIHDLNLDTETYPTITDFNPESSYGKMEILFESEAGIDEIIENFDFLQDDSEIHVNPIEEDAGPDEGSEHAVSGEGVSEDESSRPGDHARSGSQNRFFRVDADRIDKLINLVSELIISGAHIGQIGTNHNNQEMIEASYHLGRIISDIQESTMRLRMVPVRGVFQRFKRVVYDTARELGKSIELETSGGDTELDRSIIEKINDPLMHLIRNAVDHGLEDPESRVASGKSPTGKVFLKAYTEGGDIVIEVGDDGRGINRAKVLERAVDMGIINTVQGVSDYEADRLILHPGFSTASKVTNISGRGVGLDVVNRNVEELRGNLVVRSEEGVGTTFRIKLPLSLATLEGFLVKIADTHYVISLDIVLECIEFKKTEKDGDRNIINLRGEILPYMDLREVFHDQKQTGDVRHIVVVKYNDRKAGLVVDELLGEVQSVIKPMGKILGKIKGMNGSTILGNGEVALILDVPALLQMIEEKEEAILNKSSQVPNLTTG